MLPKYYFITNIFQTSFRSFYLFFFLFVLILQTELCHRLIGENCRPYKEIQKVQPGIVNVCISQLCSKCYNGDIWSFYVKVFKTSDMKYASSSVASVHFSCWLWTITCVLLFTSYLTKVHDKTSNGYLAFWRNLRCCLLDSCHIQAYF